VVTRLGDIARGDVLVALLPVVVLDQQRVVDAAKLQPISSVSGPTRFTVRPDPSVRMTRMVELSQHGSAIVIVVPEIEATGQRGSVQAPCPPVLSDQ
jgi:hypothetical protein